ncbi:MAG: glycosyltransferase family 4 protein [Bacteroidetes bacterium]|nr:glycosyltransferase family 4 protein [Bacteroidota bacterium]
MRIVIDMQALQSESRIRGIGRYVTSLVKTMMVRHPDHEYYLVLNGLFENTIEEIRSIFYNLLPQDQIKIWVSPPHLDQNYRLLTLKRHISEMVWETYLLSLNPDIILIPSLFEGRILENAVTSVDYLVQRVPTVVVSYDLIPFIYKDEYLTDSGYTDWYLEKIAQLSKADMLLAISHSSQLELTKHLNIPQEKTVNISTAAENPSGIFDKRKISSVLDKFKISKEYVLYTGNGDFRKNLTGMMEAYSLLSQKLRKTHQLVIVSNFVGNIKASLIKLAKKLDIHEGEYVLTGYIPDEELTILYKKCKVFVFPSKHEGFGLPVLEAMQMGRAVIGSKVSSIPEVIELEEALFDPFNVQSITDKMEEVLTSEGFRRKLEAHGLKQSKKFSWEKTADKCVEALTNCRNKKDAFTSITSSRMRKIAIVLDPSREIWNYKFSHNHVKVIEQLSTVYDATLINLSQADEHAMSDHLHVYTIDWFENNYFEFDRIIYIIENSSNIHAYYELVNSIPGVLYFLGIPQQRNHLQDMSNSDASQINLVYKQYGYGAIIKYFHNTSIMDNFFSFYQGIIDSALAVFVNSLEIKNNLTSLLTREIDIKLIKGKELSIKIDDLYNSYKGVGIDMLNRISQVSQQLPPKYMAELAKDISFTTPFHYYQPQLFLDISILVREDAKTGIQRVVRSLLRELLETPPDGIRVEPIYVTDQGVFHYARKFTQKFLGFPDHCLVDEPVQFRSGDIYIAMDLLHTFSKVSREFYKRFRAWGGKVYFLVYDLLCIQMPQYFVPEMRTFHNDWLHIVAENDGAICISKAVADEFYNWAEAEDIQRERPFQIDWFHLGADIDTSHSTKGLQENAEQILDKISQNTSFLMVGTLEPRKGYAQTISTFNLLWDKGLQINLVIIGKQGWLMEGIVEELQNHPLLGKRLFWLEGISDEFLGKIYQTSSCLLYTSEGEGFGLPLIEAVQKKLPIIVRDLPIFREVAGDFASYFFGLQPEDLAVAIEEWLALYKKGEHISSTEMPWLTWKKSSIQLKEILSGKRAYRVYPE